MDSTNARASTDVLLRETIGATAVLTLNRPHALNAFDTALQVAMRSALDEVARDRTVRCVILAAAGRAFCAGADLDLDDPDSPVRLAPRTEEELRMRYNPIIRIIRTMDKPVIAAVAGAAVGVGCSLALACDQVIATENATFSLAFSKVGLTLDAGASLLVGARAGFGRASTMALLAQSVDADTALTWGLVDEIVDSGAFDDRVMGLANRLSQGPTAAFAATKHSLNTALLPALDTALEAEVSGQTSLVDAHDFREGVKSFMTKRAPEFLGR